LTIAAAQKRIDALVDSLQRQFSADYPQQNAWRIRLVPLKDKIVGNVRQSVFLLFSAVGLVLLISCVNIANLLLARASARGREMALRQALGANRARLIRQLLTESLLLFLLGGVTGLAILFALKDFLLRFVPDNLPRLNEISINWTVLLFAFCASVFSGLVFGLAPAFQAGRLDLHQAFKQEGSGSAGSAQRARTRRVLVVTEFALSLILMIAASLLLRSFWDLLNVRTGFNTTNIMTVRTRMPYPNDLSVDKYATASQETPFVRELTRRCATLPGVEEVALGDPAAIPLDTTQHELNVLEGHVYLTFEGQNVDQQKPTLVQRARVTPEYFHLLGLTLLRGRLFTEFDNDTAPQVAVVNEAFGRTYWPNEDALGKRFKSTRPGSQWITVVGIIGNARTESLAQADVPQLYVNLYQTGAKHLAILLRGHLNTVVIADGVRKHVQALDSTLPVFGAQTLIETVSASLSQRRFSLEVIALFALTALLLASIGVYGVISYLVTERTREIGIRLALGAQKRNILRVVLQQGLQLAVAGAVIGLVCALIVSHVMATLLYGVKPTDPLSFGGVAALFVGVALLACYLPARRAMKIDPMVALRHE
jgi:putative ABC transport system permease protein